MKQSKLPSLLCLFAMIVQAAVVTSGVCACSDVALGHEVDSDGHETDFGCPCVGRDRCDVTSGEGMPAEASGQKVSGRYVSDIHGLSVRVTSRCHRAASSLAHNSGCCESLQSRLLLPPSPPCDDGCPCNCCQAPAPADDFLVEPISDRSNQLRIALASMVLAIGPSFRLQTAATSELTGGGRWRSAWHIASQDRLCVWRN